MAAQVRHSNHQHVDSFQWPELTYHQHMTREMQKKTVLIISLPTTVAVFLMCQLHIDIQWKRVNTLWTINKYIWYN
jgi:hypothetical protein